MPSALIDTPAPLSFGMLMVSKTDANRDDYKSGRKVAMWRGAVAKADTRMRDCVGLGNSEDAAKAARRVATCESFLRHARERKQVTTAASGLANGKLPTILPVYDGTHGFWVTLLGPVRGIVAMHLKEKNFVFLLRSCKEAQQFLQLTCEAERCGYWQNYGSPQITYFASNGVYV